MEYVITHNMCAIKREIAAQSLPLLRRVQPPTCSLQLEHRTLISPRHLFCQDKDSASCPSPPSAFLCFRAHSFAVIYWLEKHCIQSMRSIAVEKGWVWGSNQARPLCSQGIHYLVKHTKGSHDCHHPVTDAHRRGSLVQGVSDCCSPEVSLKTCGM